MLNAWKGAPEAIPLKIAGEGPLAELVIAMAAQNPGALNILAQGRCRKFWI